MLFACCTESEGTHCGFEKALDFVDIPLPKHRGCALAPENTLILISRHGACVPSLLGFQHTAVPFPLPHKLEPLATILCRP